MYKHFVERKFEDVKPNSNKASRYAESIIQSLTSDKKAYEKIFQDCFKIIDTVGGVPSRDVIKRPKFTIDLNGELEKLIKKL